MKPAIITHHKLFLDERIIESEVRAVILAGMGYTHKLIEAQTGLTPARIQARMKKAGIKLSDWREGKNMMAQMVIKAVRVDAVGVAEKISDMLYENRLLQEQRAQARIIPLNQIEDTIKRRQIAHK